MGKSYRRNDEYGNKYRGFRKSKKPDKPGKRIRQLSDIDDQWMRSGQWEQ